MYKKMLFVLCAMLMIGSAVQADVMYYRAGATNSWTDLNNWYVDSALTTGATALPTTATTVWTAPMTQDFVGVIGHDYRDTANPASLNDFWITMTGKSYNNWTKQVINVTEAGAICNDVYMGRDNDADVNWAQQQYRFQRVEINITNNSTLYCSDEYTPGSHNYAEAVTNIEAGSTLTIDDNYNLYGQYRIITNVAGQMLVKDNIDMDAGCGWAMPDYLGDLYYDFGTWDNAGEVTHTNADGDLPMEFAESVINILDGGYVIGDKLNGVNTALAPGGKVTLSGSGLLDLRGDQVALILSYKGQGLIYNADLGDDSSWTAVYDASGAEAVTHIYIPEPATMVLLGLGAVGLIRRKR